MSRLFDTLAALTIGAGYTYLTDPAHGAERRERIRGQVAERTKGWVNQATEPVRRTEWSDEMRWSVGTVGAVLFLAGSRRKGSVLTQIAGAALLARAVTNKPVMSLLQSAEESMESMSEGAEAQAPTATPESMSAPQA
jgi:hypothetical protein